MSLPKASLRLLGNCVPAYLVAEAFNRSGHYAIARKPVPLEPPQCGTFFAPTSVWNTPLTNDAPLDPNSTAITNTLLGQVSQLDDEHFFPTINTTSYSVPIYTVGATQKRVPVVLDNLNGYANQLRAQLAAGVPIPPGAQPAAGTDHHMVIWQPATDRMWELWHAQLEGTAWHAGFGGVIPDESDSTGAFFSDTGINYGATGSALALAGGLMTISELERGTINHALAFAVLEARRSVWATPASRSDGYDLAPDSIPEGAHFRLPASLDIARLHLPPLIAMMAKAVQKYGMIVRDQAGTVAFVAQDPTPGSGNPYGRLLDLGPDPLRRFPWTDLQLLKMNLRTWGNQPVSDSDTGG